MQTHRFQDAVSHFSHSHFLWTKTPVLLLAISFCTMDASAFRIQPVKSIGKCQDHTVYFKHYFVLRGEAVILKCPSFSHEAFSDLSLNLTWHKNDSKHVISGEDKEQRIQAKGDTLWFLPASLEDTGVYICTQRNSSYCVKVSIRLTVVEKTAAHDISYMQKLFTFTSGKLVCPDLGGFMDKKADLELKWYKDSVPLDEDNKKYIRLKETTSLIIGSVLPEDSGYYTCKTSFTYEGTQYPVTRTILLQTVETEKRNTPVIVYPDQKTTLAVPGYKMIIPCKVFIGLSRHFYTIVVWLANDTYIDMMYKDDRVTVGERQEIVENGENFIEVPLIFDPVREVDFYTDFKCLAQNSDGYQVLPTRVKEEAISFSWYIAMIPVALVCLLLGGLFIHKCWKLRVDKGYMIAKS